MCSPGPRRGNLSRIHIFISNRHFHPRVRARAPLFIFNRQRINDVPLSITLGHNDFSWLSSVNLRLCLITFESPPTTRTSILKGQSKKPFLILNSPTDCCYNVYSKCFILWGGRAIKLAALIQIAFGLCSPLCIFIVRKESELTIGRKYHFVGPRVSRKYEKSSNLALDINNRLS